jgi:phosphate-selective porin
VVAAQPPVDAAGKFSPLTILNDFFITFQSDYADVSVGQFKIPVSYEGYNSASKILFPERAPVARQYGDKRDMGIRVEKKLFDHLGYSAGLFNGSGQNRLDDDTEKDGALRLEGYVEGATIAGVGYATLGKRKKSSRDRLELDVKYDAHSVYLIGEYIHGWDTKGGGKAVEGNGTYVEAAYTLFDHLQPMVRFGDVDPDMDKRGDHFWHYEAGVSWLFQKNEAKLTLAGAIFDPTHPTPPTNPKKTEVILAAQAGF